MPWIPLQSSLLFFAIASLLLNGSCQPNPQITLLQQQVRLSESREADRQRDIETLHEEIKKLWRAQRCTDPRVTDFLRELENCDNETCSARNIEDLMGIMEKQQHVLLRMRPSWQPAQGIPPIRTEQMRQRFAKERVTAISRTLWMALPLNVKLSEISADKQPSAISRRIRNRVVLDTDLKHLDRVPMIGPFMVSCKNGKQIMDRYARTIRDDHRVTEEPKPTEPQIAVWIFKVDC